MINEDNPHKILIVDDDPSNHVILKGYLQSNNCEIHSIDNGRKALKTVKKLNPDIILLDIMMPGMSGFEVCEILKNDEATRDIPIIFITALSDRDAHKKAIESGGEGFIVKPFDEGLIQAYVKTFVRMKKIHDNVKQRLASNKDFASMTIHDLNNLGFAISANLELAIQEHAQFANADKYMASALAAVRAGNVMLKKFQAIMRLESTTEGLNVTPLNMIDLSNKAAGLLEAEMQRKNLGFVLKESDSIKVHGDKDLLFRVLVNLMDNAIKFAHPDTEIGLEVAKKAARNASQREAGGPARHCHACAPFPGDDRWAVAGGPAGLGKEERGESSEEYEDDSRWMEVIISNQCDPIPVEYHESIFEKFKQGPNKQKRKTGTGLGLAFSRLAVELHGGMIWIESPLPGQETGVAFHFTVPLAGALPVC